MADGLTPPIADPANPFLDAFAGVDPALLSCLAPKLASIQDGLQAKSDLIGLTVALLKFLRLPSIDDGYLGAIAREMRPNLEAAASSGDGE